MACELENIYDICILQNQTFQMLFQLYNDDGVTPINITNWTFTSAIRTQYGESTPPTFFTVSVLDAFSGSLRLYLAAQSTWDLTNSRYFYDVIGTNNNVSPPETLRLLQGKVKILPGVTEP